MAEKTTVIEHTTVVLPISMSLTERISAVSKIVSEWIKSLDKPFDEKSDLIHLADYKRNGKHVYRYVIERDVK